MQVFVAVSGGPNRYFFKAINWESSRYLPQRGQNFNLGVAEETGALGRGAGSLAGPPRGFPVAVVGADMSFCCFAYRGIAVNGKEVNEGQYWGFIWAHAKQVGFSDSLQEQIYHVAAPRVVAVPGA